MKTTSEGIASVQGFLSLGKHIGVKKKDLDFGVIFCESQCNAAAVYTQNKVKGAPLYVTQEHLKNGVAKAIAVISGNANVGTGKKGVEDAKETCRLVAKELSISPSDVVVASTGVIGKMMPMEKILQGVKGIKSGLSANDGFSKAILTTDTKTKQACVYGNGFKIAGVAKGSGMICPNMATTLCFIATDAQVDSCKLKELLSGAVDDSFNMISVDMGTSTSDMAVILANGLAGKPKDSEFAEALDFVCLELAKMVASDGEGASKLIEVKVNEAKTKGDARKIAKAIVKSNLFKCAVFGNDPNWGRALSAIGNSGGEIAEGKMKIYLNGSQVFCEGKPSFIDEVKLSESLANSPVVKVQVTLGLGKESATAYGCDLTYDYVKINSEYRLKKTGYAEKAQILLEAFSYANKFKHKIAVVKFGGSAMADAEYRNYFFEDIAILKQLGMRLVIVHGGGPFLDEAMASAGIVKKTINGLRVTDEATIALAEKVFSGISEDCVAALKMHGVSAENCTLGLLTTALKEKELGLVGEITSVSVEGLVEKMKQGIMPIVSPLGKTLAGQLTNVNADSVAASIAVALQAEKLTILTNVDGVCINDKIVSHLTISQAREFMSNGQITRGMIPKINACIKAVENKVKKAHLINGVKKHSLLLELFTSEGFGTELVENEP